LLISSWTELIAVFDRRPQGVSLANVTYMTAGWGYLHDLGLPSFRISRTAAFCIEGL
jgi:hypothetical protein